MKMVCILARVSTERQKEEKTIESQLSEVRGYCQKNNCLIVKEYIDEGYSGELLARPALDKLRDDAKSNLFQAVVMLDPDRLSRNYVNAAIVMQELQESGKEVIFINAPPTDTSEGKLLFNIQSVVAQYEKEKIRERTRRGRLHKARSGHVVGTQCPYGYSYIKPPDSKIGHLEINEDEARIVRLIFDLYTKQGLSLKEVIRALLEKDIRPKRGAEAWATSTIAKMLYSEVYGGTWFYNKGLACEPKVRHTTGYKRQKNTSRKMKPREEWIPISVPVIINAETMAIAKRKREENIKFSKRNAKRTYMLGSLLYHQGCGVKMSGTSSKQKLIYRCRDLYRITRGTKCNGAQVYVDKLDGAVLDALLQVLTREEVVNKYLEYKKTSGQRNGENLRGDLAGIERSLDGMKEKEKRVALGYADGILSAESAKDALRELGQNSNALVREREEILNNLESVSATSGSHDVASVIRSFTEALKEHRNTERCIQLVRMAVERVEYAKDEVLVNLSLAMPPQASNEALSTQARKNMQSRSDINLNGDRLCIKPDDLC